MPMLLNQNKKWPESTIINSFEIRVQWRSRERRQLFIAHPSMLQQLQPLPLPTGSGEGVGGGPSQFSSVPDSRQLQQHLYSCYLITSTSPWWNYTEIRKSPLRYLGLIEGYCSIACFKPTQTQRLKTLRFMKFIFKCKIEPLYDIIANEIFCFSHCSLLSLRVIKDVMVRVKS